MSNKSKPRIVEHDFTKGIKVTDHFIMRAHERFGLRDLHDSAKNHDYVTGWVQELLENYDEIERNQNNDDVLLVKCRQIIVVYQLSKRQCLTCYPISYNNYTKQYDTLKTAIKKRELKLDDFTAEKVNETFINIYYQEARRYAKELAELHAKIAALYQVQSKSSHNVVIDTKQETINQINSIIFEIEDKLMNIHNVVFEEQERKINV
ncbi:MULTISPECIES: hypothetical protein [unclassified Lactobacillus]|uniref:hypothetical protein n=1 Tax=unclassified Lactobacillus TaxID=2620435 RepID=UPI000EFC4851|nr:MULTISPECIES: hypothetical protein [unclassified Lactobacillus]RMC24444.1 hypothetical protein F5ESL0247_04530 [Lactobacillus sp. ESL0247]RMC28583.1 hypothetical protein F5ESL0246_04530 [Lactobacillus sp. ESL0246]RMC31775.1 hypothetical protein F5ESL0245_04535 [Lactobacillus sp. ESL0245]